jgi:hypothetical protein
MPDTKTICGCTYPCANDDGLCTNCGQTATTRGIELREQDKAKERIRARCNCPMQQFYGEGWGDPAVHDVTCPLGMVDYPEIREQRHRVFLDLMKKWKNNIWFLEPEYVNVMFDAILRVGPSRITRPPQR